ncbi:MAG: DUF6212 domain-containing protein [Candidatus Andersenbacteria bacterium]
MRINKNTVGAWFHQYRVDIFIIGVLLVVAGLPRLLDLGLFLTADEKNWIGRSYEFIQAFKDFRFNDMLQTTHPGVTALWLIGGAVMIKMFFVGVPFSFASLIYFVTAAQFSVALVITFLIAVTYILLRRLLGNRSVALLGTLMIALDPFLIGYSRVAHVDALLAHFLFAAVLATIIYRQSHFARRFLVISAVLTGLAVLTKAPAVFMVPFFWLAVITDGVTMRSWLKFKKRLRDFGLWLLIVVVMFVTIWPAILWVPDPQGNVLVLKRDLGRAALTPHHMVEDYTLNPTHYLFTLVTRVNPVLHIFVIFFIGVILWQTNRARRGQPTALAISTATLWLLLAYIVFFVIMMTLGAKKGDRYILPIWPALNLIAAAGIVMAAKIVGSIVAEKWTAATRSWLLTAYLILPIVVVGYLASQVYVYHPYAIAYSNPLFADNLSQELGWGEGLEQVGAWLDAHAPEAVVASWYPEELGTYTTAHVAHINAHEQGRVRFIVVYRNMFGREPDHYANNFIDEYFKKKVPVFVAHVAGKEFAWVYEKRVYEQVVGELVPGLHVGQVVMIEYDELLGLDLLLATYSGKATSGMLIVKLKAGPLAPIIYEWQLPVSDLEDNRWLTLRLPQTLSLKGQEVFVEIQAEGTTLGQAPTLRYARDFNYRPTNMLISADASFPAAAQKPGDLAIRLRYLRGSQEATEEDDRLLQ